MTFPLPATAYALPLVAPFRGLTQRQGMIIEGPAGWGEFAPFADYDTGRDAHWLAAAVEAAATPPQSTGELVRSNAVLPDVEGDDLAASVRDLLTTTGCRTVKLKVGGRPTGAEVRRISSVYSTAASLVGGVTLRLDANGRYDLDAAGELLAALTWLDRDVEYVEQPCDTVAELRALKDKFPGVAIAADEALRRDRQFTAVSDFADVAVVKVAPIGGVSAVREMVKNIDVPVVISGAAESSVGLSRDAVVAAELGDPNRAHGLGTGTLLADDLAADRLVPMAGSVPAQLIPVDPGALTRAAARLDPAAASAWTDRLEGAWAQALRAGLIPVSVLDRLGVSA